jgi:TetR/AcrR family transcriptional repressor of nem operon
MDGYSEKREHIIKTAAGLVHVKGFNNTSIDDILREGDIGKGQFFYYFKNKEELGYAILESQARSTAERIWDPALTSDLNPLSKIFRLLDNVVKVHRERRCTGGCPIGNMAMEMSDIHEGFRTRVDGIFHSWAHRIRETLREGVETGQLKADLNADELSDFVVASIQGAILLCTTRKDLKVMRHCFRNLKRYLMSLCA